MTTIPRDAHDRLFHAIFSHPDSAAGELRYVLGPAFARRVDWKSLEPMPTRYTGERLTSRHADLVFRARYARDAGYLVLLSEHKSAPARWTALQLLSMKTRIWEQHRNEHPNASRLPMIVPVVVHHGAGGWRGPRRFAELIHVPRGLTRHDAHQLDFELVIDDLALETAEQILARPLSAPARVALFCLRQARQDVDLLTELERHARGALLELTRHNATRALTTIWSYIRATDVPAERLLDLSRRLGPAAEEAYMTSAQQLMEQGRAMGIAQGREQGRAEGRAEGRVELLLRQLGAKFGVLGDSTVARVRAASIEQLHRWAVRVLTADSLDEVLD